MAGQQGGQAALGQTGGRGYELARSWGAGRSQAWGGSLERADTVLPSYRRARLTLVHAGSGAWEEKQGPQPHLGVHVHPTSFQTSGQGLDPAK